MSIKVLCLGAFANGNLGDMYQADAIARLIRNVDPMAEVVSTSPSKRQSAYPHAHHVVGWPGGAFDVDYINKFDLLIVGGGGLLSAPHAPLNDDSWISNVKVPICTLSLGAVKDTALSCRKFIEKCASFSVRDEFSLQAVKEIRPDASIIMDPILLDQISIPLSRRSDPSGIIWVPGKLVVGTESIWEDALVRLFQKERDTLISFNPVTDKTSGFDDIFPNVKYLESVDPFMAASLGARLVLSERYHACIYALASGVPALGVCLRSSAVTSKIEELFRRVGHPEAIVRTPFRETRVQLVERARNIRLRSVKEYLVEERDRLSAYLTECLRLAAA